MMKKTRNELIDYLCNKFGSVYGPTFPDVTLPITPNDLADILEYVNVTVRGPKEYRHGELDVTCPKCMSPPGDCCRSQVGPKGVWLPGPHEERTKKARRLEE